jgi:antitoxin (DNA-binding transcriptional repressor) of toxin-antitoxin stability system
MAALYVSELEAVRDLRRLLAQVQQGNEVIIEREAEPVALLTRPRTAKRSFAETVRLLKESAWANVDAEFAAQVEAGIEARREPHTHLSWD